MVRFVFFLLSFTILSSNAKSEIFLDLFSNAKEVGSGDELDTLLKNSCGFRFKEIDPDDSSDCESDEEGVEVSLTHGIRARDYFREITIVPNHNQNKSQFLFQFSDGEMLNVYTKDTNNLEMEASFFYRTTCQTRVADKNGFKVLAVKCDSDYDRHRFIYGYFVPCDSDFSFLR